MEFNSLIYPVNRRRVLTPTEFLGKTIFKVTGNIQHDSAPWTVATVVAIRKLTLHIIHYLFRTAGRMASNLNFETVSNCTSPKGSQRRRDVQPRQLAHRCLQSTALERFLPPPPEGVSRDPRRPGRFLHCTALPFGPTGFSVGGIATAVINTPMIFRKP
jgi:hypothetical protein